LFSPYFLSLVLITKKPPKLKGVKSSSENSQKFYEKIKNIKTFLDKTLNHYQEIEINTKDRHYADTV